MTLIILLLLSIIFIVISTTKLNLHAFLALLLVAILYGLFSGMALPELITSIQDGFGGTIGKIGIVIIAGLYLQAIDRSRALPDAEFDGVLRLTRK